jgi:hypothetical protein
VQWQQAKRTARGGVKLPQPAAPDPEHWGNG